MKFENKHLINFRNYEDIEIDISNKNVFFDLKIVRASERRPRWQASDTYLNEFA